MTKRLSNVRLLLALVVAFSMTMPATVIVSMSFESDAGVSEVVSPGMNFGHRAFVQVGQDVYEAWVEGKTHEAHIMFSSSSDNGQTWSTPVQVTDDEFVPMSVQMSAGSDSLHLTWMDGISMHLRTGYTSFDFVEGKWRAPTVFEGENPALGALGDTVAIAMKNCFELALYVSQDGGQSFEGYAPIRNIACSRPSVLLEGGKINVVCSGGVLDINTGKITAQGIYYTASDNPEMWAAPLKVADTTAPVKEISMEITSAGLRIRWTEASATSIDHYVVEETASGVFGEKNMVSSERREIETHNAQKAKSKLPPKKWTYIVYLDGDNDLDYWAWEDVNEMEVIGSNDDLNVIVLFDRADEASVPPHPPDTFCYYIQQDLDTNTITSPEIPLSDINSTWVDEVNMGDPQTAIDFVNYVYANYPADRYVWNMWNHGGSWWGMCSDDTSGGDYLTSLEVRNIYETLRADTGKRKLFDVGVYSMCLMSDVSIAYDEMPYIDYICNSEDSGWADGWRYDFILAYLNNSLDMNGEEAAWWVFQSYVQENGISGPYSTMSVINSTMFATSLMPAVNNLAQKGIHDITANRAALQTASNNAKDWEGYVHQKDLIHFCQNVVSGIPAGDIHEAAQAVITAGQANPNGMQYSNPAWQHDKAILIHNQNTNENGITIYVNDPPYYDLYDTMTVTDTNWDEFYKVLWGSDPNAPNNEPTVTIDNPPDGGSVDLGSIVTISGTASDSDGTVQRVDVAIDSQLWEAATGTNSWTYNWDTTGWEIGWHKIMARSYDGQDFSYVVHDVQITTPTAVAYDIPIASTGWQFVSFPYVGINGDPAVVFNDSINGDSLTTWDYVQYYDATDPTDPWKTYATFKPAPLNDLTSVDYTMGVWINILTIGDGVLTTGMEGAYFGSTVNINLHTGWNLVGYPSTTPRQADLTLPAEADMIAIYNASAAYRITDVSDLTTVTMMEGNAYWVRVTAGCTWNVNP